MADTQIWFIMLYDKNEATDLSPSERRLLKAAIEEEVQRRAQGRGAKRK
jgi:hypothetical protein